MRTPAEHRKGIVLMLGATLCWATAGVLVRNMQVTDGWSGPGGAGWRRNGRRGADRQ